MDNTSDGSGSYTSIVSLLVLGVGLMGLFFGVENWWLVFVIGYAVVVPIVAIVTGEDGTDEATDAPEKDGHAEDRSITESKADALDTLRERYAEGELSEAQFEAKLEALLETETLEDARAHVEKSSSTPDPNGSSDVTLDSEYEPE